MAIRVFVTGVGIVSAIGSNVKESLESIRQKRSGIGEITHLDTGLKDSIPVGEVPNSNNTLMDILGISKRKPIPRTALLGMMAAKEALTQAKIEDISDTRMGLISATTVGGMDKSEQFYVDFLNNQQRGRLRNAITHDCGDTTEKIANYLGIRGYLTTISTACSSSANAVMFGARLIKHGILDRVLVGGSDSLTKFTLNGFNSLMILDKEKCKPFDNERKGLNIGEGAGFIVLEGEHKVNGNVLCELKGYGNANDAFHQTASSPEGNGAFLAMEKALKNSGLKANDIDYINAHGTGTQNNDLSEGRAVERIFGKAVPKISSTKSFTGHTLGAAGGIEAVLSVLSIQNGLIFPNLHFSNQMEEIHFSPETELQESVQIQHVLSNSFGFGGNSSTLIFSKYE